MKVQEEKIKGCDSSAESFVLGEDKYIKCYDASKSRFMLLKNNEEISLEEWNSAANFYHPMRNKEEHRLFLVRWLEIRRRRKIIKLLGVRPDEVVIDIGCESGYISNILAPKCQKIYCLDIDQNILNMARERIKFQNVEFICADALTTQIPDNSVDVVLCTEVLEHLESPREALLNIYRILTPRGRVLLGVPNESLNLMIKKLLNKLEMAKILGRLSPGMAMGHLHLFDKSGLASIIDPKLFEVQRIFYDKPFLLNIYALLKPKKGSPTQSYRTSKISG